MLIRILFNIKEEFISILQDNLLLIILQKLLDGLLMDLIIYIGLE